MGLVLLVVILPLATCITEAPEQRRAHPAVDVEELQVPADTAEEDGVRVAAPAPLAEGDEVARRIFGG